ncbi:hypothetical protein E2562_031356 [Oryza meyeriana var. granulata]|uniref:DUF4220 domain-containing protein n=1 Tax=Oryza meyeriana var. granulata TaxID=110450 RepID=A0A6G1D9M9_9ORYZ|nr:hypothetical protein E2562_031356 [Oryza meyeriana var. granulata]
MDNLLKLYHEREIQLLVLLSFTLQMFLFFSGSLRARRTNVFLRVSIWTAYLGADFAAVYALGYLSQHDPQRQIPGRTQPLAFFWASFLLIHLGGQDTITAFSMADNNLWLRHFLNLVVQVVLAAYVFWKSAGRHSVGLQVSGVFVFVAGVIKYGERTWSLKCGRFKSLESSTGHHYKKRFSEVNDSDSDYSKIVLNALRSMLNVHDVFAARNPFVSGPDDSSPVTALDAIKMFKVVELELAMMYNDLYTKALVLRTRIGIMLRCISHTCSFVAFALFLASGKQSYSRVDIAITYSLFIGGFFLDLSAMLIWIMSPWTWAWLKARKYDWLANLSWFLFSSDIGWPEKRSRWSNSIGQYNLLSWVSGSNQPRSCNQKVMALVRRLLSLAGVGKENLFWMSKLLDTEYVEADEKTMEFVVKGISRLHDEFSEEQQWPNLGPLLKMIRIYYVADFGCAIVVMHIFTAVYLNAVEATAAGGDANGMLEVCRKLSNYMMYLFVNHPSMLPLNASSEATVVEFAKSRRELFRKQGSKLTLEGLYNIILQHEDGVQPRGGTLEELYKMIIDADVQPSNAALEEMAAMWMRLLIFAAGRSNGKVHTAELARGGELITFAWLLMAREGLGESERTRVRMTSTISSADSAGAETDLKEAYAFFFPD